MYQVASVYQVVCMRPVYQVVSGPHTKYSGRLVLIRNTLGVWSSYEIQWESSDLCIAPVYHPCVSPLCITPVYQVVYHVVSGPRNTVGVWSSYEIQWTSGPRNTVGVWSSYEIQWASGPRNTVGVWTSYEIQCELHRVGVKSATGI